MRKRLFIAIAVAALLWFYMFSPWTSGLSNFWFNMSCAALVLSALALSSGVVPALFQGSSDSFSSDLRSPAVQILIGVALAFALWGVFWLGDKVSQLMFDFARGQVDNVYSMKTGLPSWVIALLLLFVIGPAEEIFWRGYVQTSFQRIFASRRFPADLAFLVTVIIYALVHIWSFNFMLVMAALVAGAVWGFIYRLRPSLLPALVVSHALWDALVFIILPI